MTQPPKPSPLLPAWLEIEALFQYLGFTTLLIQAQENRKHPFEELLLTRETKHKEKEVLRIKLLNEQLKQIHIEEKALIFQFLLNLPIQTPTLPSKRKELPALLLLLNQLLPLGTLAWAQKEGLYLRYCLLWEPGSWSGPVMVEIAQNLFWGAKTIKPWLERFSDPKTSLQYLEKQIHPVLTGGS
ncbi:MAG: hypothetical protein IV090_05920 [Candidatus Sericytochromatia bacterium]|nr:hypothetical protein [Candidatus Sericytochromatia bacterium]